MRVIIRAMAPQDLDAVMQIQADAYPPEIVESRSVFAARLQQCPQSAFVAQCDEQVLGYLMGYRSRWGALSAFASEFSPQAQGEAFYLHDVAVASAARGRRLAPQLVGAAVQCAQSWGCTGMALVAVLDAQAYWQSLGFAPASASLSIESEKLASYAGNAVYMTREFTNAFENATDVGVSRGALK